MLRNIVSKLNSLENRNSFYIFSRFKSTVAVTEEYDIEDGEETTDTSEEDRLKEEELERKRNKSRLRQDHLNLLHNNVPFPEPLTEYHKSVKYQRRIYGVYGETSGLDPKICWPTSAEIANIKEYEEVAYPYTIKQMMEHNAQKRKEFEEKRQQRQSEIVKKFAKLDQMKKDLADKIAKKEAEARAVKERKDRLVEEVRRHFGFKIDHRDERFKEMLEQKEKAEKKAMKEAKRKVKEAKYLAKLQETNVQTTAEANKPTEGSPQETVTKKEESS